MSVAIATGAVILLCMFVDKDVGLSFVCLFVVVPKNCSLVVHS